MIRVTFAEREPEEIPANLATTSADGSLVLEWMELAEMVDQNTLRRQLVVTGKAWVRTYSRATGWLTAAPVLAEVAEGADEVEPASVEESTVEAERDLEEAIR